MHKLLPVPSIEVVMPCYELTSANSSKVVPEMENNTCIVLHHMNSCIHCQMFKPVWKQITDKYKSKKPFMLVSVEYDSMNLLPASMRDVQAFPTLRAYKNAKPIAEFNDTRTYDAVIDFIEKYGKNDHAKTKAEPKSEPKAELKAKTGGAKKKPKAKK